MINYLRGVLGNYTPLSGEGIASLNIEYIVAAILLIMAINISFKFLYRLLSVLFGDK